MSDTQLPGGREYANHELRAMDEATARKTLTVNQYERWDKLNELYDEAEQTRQEWQDNDDTVAAVTVSADMDDLGSEVEIYGNDLLVHVDSTNGELERHMDAADDILGDTDPDKVESLSDDDVADLSGHLQAALEEVIIRWDGAEWDAMTKDNRADVLATAAEKWGIDGLLMAWFDIITAIAEDREEKVSAVESFRNPERRGRR